MPAGVALLVAVGVGCGPEPDPADPVPAEEPTEPPDDAAPDTAEDEAVGEEVDGLAREASGFPIADPPDEPDEEATGGPGLLPHPFPAELPLPPPPEGEITNSYGVADGANVQLRIALPFEEVVAFFEEALPAAGWDIEEQDGRDAPTVFERFEAVGHDHEVQIRVEERDDTASAMVRVRRHD